MATFDLHMENLPKTVELVREDGKTLFRYIDQRLLPEQLVFEETGNWQQVVDAIKTLAVRGAPAIGVSGAAAIALWAAERADYGVIDNSYVLEFELASREIADARPTAVNLYWGVRRAVDSLGLVAHAVPAPRLSDEPDECAAAMDFEDANEEGAVDASKVADDLFDLVKQMEAEDEAVNRAIGKNGAELLGPESRVLTHCNAGSLATVFYGTALGVVYAASEQGKIERVFADETRPVGQGARLTTWELAQAGVPVTLQCDDMAAYTLATQKIDAVIVGADRIARNGDAANKIGTFGLAIMAAEFNVPFYVAAPTSTVDAEVATGDDIVIEQRDASEVLPAHVPGVDVLNPAFDVTPSRFITAIITEKGVFEPSRIAEAVQ